MNILFICTSNKDRSHALAKYFSNVFPQHSFFSAGINKYFTDKKNTNYLSEILITLADLIVYCEDIHREVAWRNFDSGIKVKDTIVLGLGDYIKGDIGEDYLLKAENKLRNILTQEA